MGAFATSYMPSAGATATRNGDVLPFPFPPRPQAMTIYVRLVFQTQSDNTDRLIHIGKFDNTDPRLFIQFNGRMFHIAADGSSVNVTLATTRSIGQVVEFRGLVAADGSVQLGESINSAAETLTAQSAALQLSQNWSDQILWINGVGGDRTSSVAIRNILIHRGVQSLETMRRLASV